MEEYEKAMLDAKFAFSIDNKNLKHFERLLKALKNL